MKFQMAVTDGSPAWGPGLNSSSPAVYHLPPTVYRLLLSTFCLFLPGCAGYHIGNATLFPPDISTVYVPMVDSHSFRPDLGEALDRGDLQTNRKGNAV